MKTTLLALIILCAATALGQTARLIPNQPEIVHVPDNPMQAEAHAMATEHSLVGGGPDTYTYAHGERPLWEFGPVSEPVPLGDVARAYRKEKLTARKATKILEKQGS